MAYSSMSMLDCNVHRHKFLASFITGSRYDQLREVVPSFEHSSFFQEIMNHLPDDQDEVSSISSSGSSYENHFLPDVEDDMEWDTDLVDEVWPSIRDDLLATDFSSPSETQYPRSEIGPKYNPSSFIIPMIIVTTEDEELVQVEKLENEESTGILDETVASWLCIYETLSLMQ